MNSGTKNRPDVRDRDRDRGHRLVVVSRLIEVCNPFLSPPWGEVASLTIEGIRHAIEDGFTQSQPYSAGSRERQWTAEDHIARIAYLATQGWDDPIGIDVGIPFMNCWVDWPVVDGNHRLAAAIVREETYILASVSGCCSYMHELLGKFLLPPATLPHARPRTFGA